MRPSSRRVLIHGCRSGCRSNQAPFLRYPADSSLDIIASHICCELAHSNTGRGFGRIRTGVRVATEWAVDTDAGQTTVGVSAVSVGVVLLVSGRMMSALVATSVEVWTSSVIGAHCVCQAMQRINRTNILTKIPIKQ